MGQGRGRAVNVSEGQVLGQEGEMSGAGTLRSESETERKPEVPASPRGEALFRCARLSGAQAR